MNNSFYSKSEDYEIPSTSNYYKFEDGDNKFRILGSFSEKTAIQGIEYWKTKVVDGNSKRIPIRLPKNPDGSVPSVPANDLELNKYGNVDIPKYFWALPVWNYQEKKVQILEITQSSILKYIKKVIDNPKWGNPKDYDFIVTRSKNGEKVEYTVTNDPKEPLDKAILDQYKAMDINIYALFEGGDPFADKSGEKIADAADKALNSALVN